MAKRSIEIILEGRNETRSPFSDARAEMKRWEAEVQRTSRNVRAASKAGDEGNAAGQAAAMAAAQERAATLRQTADHRKALADRLAAYKQHKAAEAATRSQALAAAAAAERAATAREAQAGRAALADRLAEFKRAKAMERTLAELHAQEMTASAVKTANATAGPAAAATAQTSRLMRTLIGGSGSAEAKINGVKYALQGLVGAVPGLDMVATSI
ncbi:MAG: hypothetical protein GX591_14020, partial [Planctomycetes bacterium]|nr:hypothetical protein [Planctomycetota bacterium]